MTWSLVALGLAIGPWLTSEGRLACLMGALVAAIAIGAGSPARRRTALAVLGVGAAVVVGEVRADVIDRQAEAPLASVGDAGRGDWHVVTLREPLSAGARDRSSSALATLAGGAIVVGAVRFGRPSPALPRGAIVRVDGPVVALGSSPGDARLRRSGVGWRILTKEIVWSGERRGGALGAIDRFGESAQRMLNEATGARRGALLAGMALGIDGTIPQADRDALRTAGLWHLVAASGGNIALVVALVMVLGWMVGLPDRTRLVLAALAIIGYVPLAGAGPSIVRAGVMGLAGLLALALGRERRAADALALAAVATLALDPRATLDVGWQLSFVAAAGLIVAAPRVARELAGLGVPRWLAAGLACTVVATVVTAPISLLTFGELSLIGLVANALVLPLVGVAVWSGTLAAVLTPVAPAVAGLVAQPGGLAAGATLAVADWAQTRSLAVIGWNSAVGLLVAAALLWIVRPPRVAVAAIALGGLGWLAFAVPRPPREPRLLVLDIGQGNATLLQDGSDAVLVDAGPIDGGIVSLIRRAGVRRLRAVILSHPAADHDGGGAAAIRAVPTDLVIDGGTPGGGPTHDADVRAARDRGVRTVPARVGQQLSFGRISLRLRWPTPAASRQPGDPNDRAAVVDARIGTLTALLPADAEGNVLTTLRLGPRAVLVVSHHGSTDDHLPQVLQTVRPQLGIISVGRGNTYGHPTRPTLAALQQADVPTLRTDLDGTIDVRAGPTGQVVVRRGPPARR